jgi:hypothetical protein
LYKGAERERLKQLFWNHGVNEDFWGIRTLFYDVESNDALTVAGTFSVDEKTNTEKKSGLAIIFDDQNIPVLATTIDYSTPVSK